MQKRKNFFFLAFIGMNYNRTLSSSSLSIHDSLPPQSSQPIELCHMTLLDPRRCFNWYFYCERDICKSADHKPAVLLIRIWSNQSNHTSISPEKLHDEIVLSPVKLSKMMQKRKNLFYFFLHFYCERDICKLADHTLS